MKKIILTICLLLLPISVYADSAHSAIIMDVDSGRILYENNINAKKLIASTTKIMTCIIVLENSLPEEEIVVGDEVLSMYGTNIYVEVGEKMKVIDLLYGLMLRSGNDAAITLAVNTLGETEFISKMNEKAKELGMDNTFFENPHGLDDDTRNYSTAYDMALLAKYAYKNKIYREIISTKKYTAKSNLKSYVWYNRMALINKYNNCIGGKNGYTPSAGKTLVSYAKNDDLILTIVSLDDPQIYENHINLYEKYFLKYKNYTIIDKDKFLINSFDGKENYFVKENFKYPLLESEIDDISTLVSIDSTDTEIVGKINIKLKDENVGNIQLFKNKQIKKEKKSLFRRILNLFSR